MSGRSHHVSVAVLSDSMRGSLIVTLPPDAFIMPLFAERRAIGPFAEMPVASGDDVWLSADKLVTCVLVAWAVTIFVGMSYLAAII